jgi:hypothetical protein
LAQSCRSWNELLWNDRVTDKELHKWSPSATDKESGQIILSVPQDRIPLTRKKPLE